MKFKPADLNLTSKAVTSLLVFSFIITFSLSLSAIFYHQDHIGSPTVMTLLCLVLGFTLVGSWLFSVKTYIFENGKIIIQHPLWSAPFKVRGLAEKPASPFPHSTRLFAAQWVFGRTFGLMFDRKIGRFLAYETNPKYRIALETQKGVLVISPADRDRMIRIIVQASRKG